MSTSMASNPNKRARSGIQTPDGIRGPTSIMPLRTAQDAALRDLALVDYFAHDPRPTLILDTSDTERNHVAYRNPALERLIGSTWSPTSFTEWTSSVKSTSTSATFGDKIWTCVLMQQRWLIVSTSGAEHSVVKEVEAGPPRTLAHASTQPLQRVQSERSSASLTSSTDTRRYSATSSSWRTTSDDGSRFLDWTQYPNASLSAHIHLVRNFPWSKTSLGSMQTWSDVLRQNVVSAMANPDPRLLLWGEEHIMIYNEACIPMFGAKHPRALGSCAIDTWSDIWHELGPLIKYVEVEGRGTHLSKLPLAMARNGHFEDTFWSFNLIPIIASDGRTVGIIDEFSEVTEQVVSDRRRDRIVKINRRIAKVNNITELWREFLQGIEPCKDDIPYALLHTVQAWGSSAADKSVVSRLIAAPSQVYRLEGSVGLSADHPAVPLSFTLGENISEQDHLAHICYKAWKTGDVVVLQAKDATLPEIMAESVPGRASGDKVTTVCVVPLPDLVGDQTMAFLTLALTPRLPYNSEAAMFAYYMRDILVKSASAICLPAEHRRARQKFEQIEASLAQQLRSTALEAERLGSRYANMSQMAPVGMYAITPDSRTTFYNQAYLDITGITVTSIEARTDPAEFIHEADVERVMGCWAICLEDKQPFTLEYRVKKPWTFTDSVSGEVLTGDTWVLATAAPELDENGNIIQINGWLLDTSDRKYHEKARIAQIETEQSETRFSRLAADAPLGMYLLTPDGHPLYLNDAYFNILGFTREEFQEAERNGVGWADQIYEEDRARVGEAWMALAQEGIPLNLEYRVKKPWTYIDEATGTQMTGETWLQGTAVAEIGIDGTVVAVQGFVTEISLKKFSERLLAEKLEDALENKKQADRFIDMTSHEMRNPLSAILQSADGILTSLENNNRLGIMSSAAPLDSDTIETVIDSAQTIILCAQHQKRIVDDILTLSKLDSNLLVISPDTVYLPGLIERCFKMYDAELERAQISATLQIHQNYQRLAVANVMLDSSRLLQVIINLLTNAIKFTQYSDRRQITIHVDASLSRPERGMYGAAYVPFRPGRPEHSFTAEWGTGAEIFLLVSVEDSGKGMDSDELSVLFNRFSQASPKTYKQYGGSGLGLFISRELTVLQDGQIGVSSVPGRGSTFSFYIKARRAVEDDENMEEGRLSTPTLVSSPVTYARENNGSRNESGPGPTAHHGLNKHSVAHTQNVMRTMSVSSNGTQHSAHLHVLVVEDNIINQRVMAQQLRRLGCTVHLANHGLEALDFLKTTTFWRLSEVEKKQRLMREAPSPKTNLPDEAIPLSVVLMDLEMPVLGGLETIKRIRALQTEGHIIGHVPVIAVTANARSEQIAVAIDHGMDSVVTKPFRIPELVPQMEALVARISSGRGSFASRKSVVGAL